ncbi:IPT/TIG domain-containing protein [Hymenobacter sp. BT683]|uniref:IPT/TIG domain-containing protein n=1 Tax=Hymenobacter jeongseonensis TaxID=2791027 RepID=A0ABS0IMW3_9BACT|nr:IPT/TIG domain-containing protein [Hymenobacter jeongseonensis]MBF9239691.1 IPT/TIG domain-containing protein [Hymenobacter jeongseonensis]
MQQWYSGRLATQRSFFFSTFKANLNHIGTVLLLAWGASLSVKAQQTAYQRSPAKFFQANAEARAVAATSPLAAALFRSQALTLDVPALRAALAAAPKETQPTAAPLVLALPLPNGGTGRFAVHETSVLAPALAARFPSIKTYAGSGLDDVSATVRLEMTPQGFHAQVLAGDGNSFYIDPVTRNDSRHYLGFYHRDMNRGTARTALNCGFAPTAATQKATAKRLAAQKGSLAAARASGPQLRTYRLALACTPEYAVTKGNTVASVLAAEATTVNRVVGVYEKELSVRMVLVPNNDQLVFLSGTGPQPSPAYSNEDGGEMLDQNQINVDRIIGTANYDIGHVVSTGGGGVAYLGVVCSSTQKAGGVTGSPNPVGDAFDIDYVAHEMGHQFGGNHPFNGNADNCAGGNRNRETAWEPGSGSTIMAYAGICGSANDLQASSDATFHTGTYEEMRAFIDGTTCGTSQATGNTAPVVTVPASGKTLPIGTPFKLTATATDAENDALTYSWEELDLGPSGTPTTAQVPGQNVPLFRSFNPTASGTRYFPRLSNLLVNNTVLGERLPTVTRALTFRCTARDQHVSPLGVIGGVNYSSLVSLDVSSSAGPFLVTAPNSAVSWTGGAAQTVTWNVAGTTAAPVSCARVNLRLSLDGGLTYPVLLAANELNDGSAVVVAPSPATAETRARLMVEAVDNYFFDISNANFTITPPSVGPSITSFTPTGGLAGTVVTVLGSQFTGATSVKFNGTAAASFTVNSATQLTATVAAGSTTGPITITAPTGTVASVTPFVVGAPPTITSFTPATGPVGSSVVITGTAFTGATRVTFNGAVSLAYTVNSATQLTATVPNAATTGPIAVTTPVNTAQSTTNFVVIQAPVILSFTPTAGGAGTVVQLTGENFVGVTRVTFNGTVAPIFTVNSSTKLTVTVPAQATTGPIVVTAAGGVGTSTTSFLIPPANDLCTNAISLACGQTVRGTSVANTNTGDPTSGCSTTIDNGGVFYSIVGTGGNITVSVCSSITDYDTKLFVFSGTCQALTCVGDNDDDETCGANSLASSVTFRSVAGTSYLVMVGGYDGETGAFALSASCAPVPLVPVITSLNATSGPVGTTLTVTGSGFAASSSVTFNGTAATTVTVASATSLTVQVPTGATTGNVVVTTTGGTSNGVLFTVSTATATTNATKSEFSVWPNPVAGKALLNVTLATSATKAQATLRNVLGQLVATRTFSGSATELSTAGLAAGTYLLSVQMDGRAPSIQRVMVE